MIRKTMQRVIQNDATSDPKNDATSDPYAGLSAVLAKVDKVDVIKTVALASNGKMPNGKASEALTFLKQLAMENLVIGIEAVLDGKNGFAQMGAGVDELRLQLYGNGTDSKGTKTRRAVRAAQEAALDQAQEIIVFRAPVESGKNTRVYGAVSVEGIEEEQRGFLLELFQKAGVDHAYGPGSIRCGDCWNWGSEE